MGKTNWPKPTTDFPSEEKIQEWMVDGQALATDGCIVEVDGVCPHGYPSWLIYLDLI